MPVRMDAEKGRAFENSWFVEAKNDECHETQKEQFAVIFQD